MNPPVRVALFANDLTQGTQLASLLAAQGFFTSQSDQIDLAPEIIRRERPDAVIVWVSSPAAARSLGRLGESAQHLKISSIVVASFDADTLERVGSFDEWVEPTRLTAELIPRLQKILKRPQPEAVPTIDPRFLALVVHDLRTPLNVIGLTIRAVAQSNTSPDPEFEEDLRFLQENAKQIERMLAQLGDYCRLIESERNSGTTEFQTRRFLADFLEEKQAKKDLDYKSVRLEYGPETPEEVALDPSRVRLALSHALANAVGAAGDAPVKIRSRGSNDLWMIDIIVEKAPPATITPTRLQPHLFERLLGFAAERRGLDLAIAARVSELFGGSAKLDIEPGVRSIITLEWPTRIAS